MSVGVLFVCDVPTEQKIINNTGYFPSLATFEKSAKPNYSKAFR